MDSINVRVAKRLLEIKAVFLRRGKAADIRHHRLVEDLLQLRQLL